MSLKRELEIWDTALNAYDELDFEKALELFSSISDSSKILTNMGLIYAAMGNHKLALDRLANAVALDQYLAVGYFQGGICNFHLARYKQACEAFTDALLYLRGNGALNYGPLGLNFRLCSAEILFNQGLCLIYMGHNAEGLTRMEEAKQVKLTVEHDVIDAAIAEGGEGYSVFCIPVGLLFRPSKKKIISAHTVCCYTTTHLGQWQRPQVGSTAPGPQQALLTGENANQKIFTGKHPPPTASASSATHHSYAASSSKEEFEVPAELVKIRVELHYADVVRGLTVSPDIPFAEFMARVTTKLDKEIDGFSLRFEDEDGCKVSLRDESDFELAIETVRESFKGKPEGKLEFWCTDN